MMRAECGGQTGKLNNVNHGIIDFSHLNTLLSKQITLYLSLSTSTFCIQLESTKRTMATVFLGSGPIQIFTMSCNRMQ